MGKRIEREVLWQEDDAFPPDAESLSQAYERLFGEPFYGCADEKAISTEDRGDEFSYLYAEGLEVQISYPGNSGIYRRKPLSPNPSPIAEEEMI